MTEEILSDKDTCERYIAFLDIMGTKDRLQREGHDKSLVKHKALLFTKRMIDIIPALPEKDKLADIKCVMFSDSIILISEDNLDKSLKDMISITRFLLHSALKIGLPIKGAIASGRYTYSKVNSINFGQPLIDAFELQNELQLFGVVLHHTVEETLRKYDTIDESAIVNIRVPMKSGNITHYLINWIDNMDIIGDNPQELVSKLYYGVSGKPRIYVDNTLDFVREIQKRKAELKKKETKKTNPFRV
jgi:hypothetical protein